MQTIDRLKEAIKTLKEEEKIESQAQIATDLGYKRAQTISDMVTGKATITTKFVSAFLSKYGIRKEWWESGKLPVFVKPYPPSEEESFEGNIDEKSGNDSKPLERNARGLGTPIDLHKSKAGISYVELSEGSYLMYAPHVTVRARAGFQGGGYGDPIYIESLPKYPMIVRTVHKGSYFVFDIDGDSMDDGTLNSIPDKSKVLAREIKLELWRSRFHYNEFPYFIIVHKTDGILCKEIIKHDVEKGVITCHSLNPNKQMYEDFEVSLDDCLMICNVVKKELDARGY